MKKEQNENSAAMPTGEPQEQTIALSVVDNIPVALQLEGKNGGRAIWFGDLTNVVVLGDKKGTYVLTTDHERNVHRLAGAYIVGTFSTGFRGWCEATGHTLDDLHAVVSVKSAGPKLTAQQAIPEAPPVTQQPPSFVHPAPAFQGVGSDAPGTGPLKPTPTKPSNKSSASIPDCVTVHGTQVKFSEIARFVAEGSEPHISLTTKAGLELSAPVAHEVLESVTHAFNQWLKVTGQSLVFDGSVIEGRDGSDCDGYDGCGGCGRLD